MADTAAPLKVVTSGQTLTVAVSTTSGAAPSYVYTDAGLTTLATFPATITSDTTWYVPGMKPVSVSVKYGSYELGPFSVTPGSGSGSTLTPIATPAQIAATESGTYALKGLAPFALPRWRNKLASSASSAKLVIHGDSTSEAVSGAGYMYYQLKSKHTLPGEGLEGLTGDYFQDGVTTSGSPTFTSASANFSAADVGKAFFPGNTSQVGIPTTVLSFQSATSITLSTNALATATAVNFTLERRIQGFGYSGLTLSGWLADSAKQAALVAAAPDLIVGSWLLNDVRLGLTDLPTAIGLLKSYVAWVQTNLPNTDLLLRIPAPMLTTDVGGAHFVQTSGGTVNPAGLAQTYSTLIRNAYLAIVGQYANVDVLDLPADVFGTQSRASSVLMADQLHPSVGYFGGGYLATADAIAARIGGRPRGSGFTSDTRAYQVSKLFVCNGGGTGFIDLATMDQGPDAAQWPLTSSYSLLIAGVDTPLSLASANIYRPFGAGIRITSLPSPANTVDFTSAYTGRAVMAFATDAKLVPTTGNRQIVSVDLPSIAAGATTTVTVTVTGAGTGDAGTLATNVVATPASGFATAGLLLLNCYPSATNTVTLVISNPTGGAIDRAAENWAFWVIR